MRTPLLASCLLLLCACGGGGGGGGGGPPPPPPGPVTVDLPPIVDLSGWGSATGGGAISTGTGTLYAGDLADTNEARAVVSFPLTSIPASAAVTAAELRIVQATVLGTPYTDFTSLEVESVDLGVALEFADLFAPSLSSAGFLAPFSAALETKTLDVLAPVLADRIAGRERASLRLRFLPGPDGDGQADRAGFSLPAGDPTQSPVLRVTYQP